ncbi:TlpA family protein disulfide reductase [Vulgatibacter incomptus]|uniref:Thioredoxin domain-containing protein n=1 Tax=Vulgatibacter incomptus TaxID=1391653 RepID=A0A0K1PDD0_9BACT|nr:TlpA disulfide reductase family protein [Vulgatibacter incomptus]AKU91548.1 hypothetical protein AKJ08_1935 [Vulgatibacter incomptus]
MRRLLFFIVVAAVIGACGPIDDGVGGTGGDGGQSDRSQYPTGPYGVKERSVIDNLSFADVEGAPISLNDIFSNEKNRVLLISAAAEWCAPCIEEKQKLAALYNEFHGRGLEVMVGIFQNAKSQPATLETIRAWRNDPKGVLPYHVVLDDQFKLGNYYNTDLFPMNMVVNLDDMKIVKIMTSFDEPTIRAVIQGYLPK